MLDSELSPDEDEGGNAPSRRWSESVCCSTEYDDDEVSEREGLESMVEVEVEVEVDVDL